MLKKQSFLSLLLVLILSFSLSACNEKKDTPKDSNKQTETMKAEETKYPLTFKDSYDREITLEKEPLKVISLAPNITETIFAIGENNNLIGRTDFCNYPEEAKNITSIGGLQNPSIEKITELKPDLIIASTHFKKETLQKLEALGMKVAVLYGENNFDGAYTTIEKVGKVLNAQSEAQKIISNMKKKVENIKEKVKGKETPSVYYVLGYGQSGDFTAGKGTFISEAIKMAGGINTADDTKGWKYSIEKLVEKNPDILICSKYFDTKNGIKNTTGYKDLDAVKNNKLFEIDNNMLDRQGPRLADGLESLAKIIHPETFK